MSVGFGWPVLGSCIGLWLYTQQHRYADVWDLFAQPGVGQAWWSGVWIGLCSTLGCVWITLYLIAHLYPLLRKRHTAWLLSPFVAMPNVSMAVAFTFLFAPSGWLFKILANGPLNMDFPPQLITIQDPLGLSLTLCLICKEVPFLLMMTLSSFNWSVIDQQLIACKSLGYSSTRSMWKIIFPQMLRHIRLPIYAIAAYGLSVVDLSLLLGPNTPSTFAVMVWQWGLRGDAQAQQWSVFGAVALCLCTLGLLGVLRLLEWLYCAKARNWQVNGQHKAAYSKPRAAYTLFVFFIVLFVAAISVLVLWSLAARWVFPAFLPSVWTLEYWISALLKQPQFFYNSLSLALSSSAISLMLALAAFEYQLHRRVRWSEYVICLPLFIPQITLLFGVQILWLNLGLTHGFWAVLWGHCLFVFPYVYLSLVGPYFAFDPRYTQAAQLLGKPIWTRLTYIKWPLLKYPIFIAFAVGFGISIAQYLPTQLLGGGRISTITTEAVATGSGLDRQYAGVYAFLQLLLPCFIYLAVYFSQRPRIAKHVARTH